MPLSAAKQIIEFLVLLRVLAENSWVGHVFIRWPCRADFFVGVGVAAGISN